MWITWKSSLEWIDRLLLGGGEGIETVVSRCHQLTSVCMFVERRVDVALKSTTPNRNIISRYTGVASSSLILVNSSSHLISSSLSLLFCLVCWLSSHIEVIHRKNSDHLSSLHCTSSILLNDISITNIT